jgi:signal transduction histidine kinase
MHDLSLYLLELIENSVRAGATTVVTTIVADRAGDHLTISVEDDGHGLKVTPDQALDPFYTTKQGKKTGLGLSLFRQDVESAGGTLAVDRSPALGGVAVSATMGLTHVDRPALGDVLSTLLVMVATNPEVDFRLEVADQGRRVTLRGTDISGRSGALRDGEQLLAGLQAAPAAVPAPTLSSGDTVTTPDETRSVG